jgi:hypothetical protein
MPTQPTVTPCTSYQKFIIAVLSLIQFTLTLDFIVIIFTGLMSRMVPATALLTAVPDIRDRGAFSREECTVVSKP